jgi:signal transduction histidine kinase
MRVDLEQVLRHSGELQLASTSAALTEAIQRLVVESTRYRAAWIASFDPESPEVVRILAATGPVAEIAARFPTVPLGADAMLEELAIAVRPVIVEDARTDPRTNKETVARYGNRTIVNVPILVGGAVRGALGAGSFGDEGVVVPSEAELDALVSLGMLVGPAVDRVRALEERDRLLEQRRALERHVENLQRVEIMGLLSAGIAHDLNNLLAVTVASLGRIRPESLGADGELLVDALDALAHIRAIAKNLVHLGRERGTTEARVSLTERVAASLELVMPSIPRGVHVVRSAHGDPFVEVEATQIDQAITNLVLNARDAVGERGRITVDVSEHVVDPARAGQPRARPGRYGVVQVRDSGPGVRGEQLARIFDPLFTTKPLGSGLGLAVVSRIAERHGGFVSVSSRPGEGACFELFLPAR